MENRLTASVYAIIEKHDRVLLTEDEEKPGWKLPGGMIEKSELLLDGLSREVTEETGLDIEPTGLISIQNYLRSDGTPRIRVYFRAAFVRGKVENMPGEVRKISWLTRRELKNLKKKDFFIEPYFLAIQDYLENRICPISIVKEMGK